MSWLVSALCNLPKLTLRLCGTAAAGVLDGTGHVRAPPTSQVRAETCASSALPLLLPACPSVAACCPSVHLLRQLLSHHHHSWHRCLVERNLPSGTALSVCGARGVQARERERDRDRKSSERRASADRSDGSNGSLHSSKGMQPACKAASGAGGSADGSGQGSGGGSGAGSGGNSGNDGCGGGEAQKKVSISIGIERHRA
jgi:hypothetical protein